MSKNIVARDDIKAEAAEALQPVSARLENLEQLASWASADKKNLNERLCARANDCTRR